MEEKHKDHTPPSTSPMARSSEISIDVSSTDEEDIRKLYDASKTGSIQTLNTLLRHDPNLIQKLSISTTNVESPLHMSVSHGHLEFTCLLLDHNPELAVAVDAYQQTPLHVATTNGNLESVRALLEKNTSACLVRDQKGLIPLHYALINGQVGIIQELIDARPQSVWMTLENGQTILHLCVESNHFEGLKLLIERFMNHDEDFLNAVDDKGNTILDQSLMQRQSEMVGYLVSIPEVKTGTRIENFTGIKGSAGSKILKRSRTSSKRQRKLASSPSSKKTGSGCWNTLRKKLKYKGDWVEEVQGTMMLVATVIATVAFQGGLDPPGGVWQQDTQLNCSDIIYTGDTFIYDNFCESEDPVIFPAGTAIMRYQQPLKYWTYMAMNTISLLASMSVMLLIISRFPLKNRICSLVLAIAMCVAVVFLGIAYLLGVQLVTLTQLCPKHIFRDGAFFIIFVSSLGVLVLVAMWHAIRFLVWLLKKRSCLSSSSIPQML